jgi:phospholipid transport system substrate-binding protein
MIFAYSISFAAVPPRSESPTEVIRATLTEVIRILENPTLNDQSTVMQQRHKLEELVADRFDYTEMSKRTLAAHWNKLNDDQRAEFVKLFKGFLSDRYGNRIQNYSGEQVQYLGERREGQYAEVRTKLVSNKTEIPMDYRLVNKSGRWYAYDIVVDGISLVKNYRSQFEKIIRSSSYQELTARLRNRTAGGDLKEK